jgi:hypothetical protein
MSREVSEGAQIQGANEAIAYTITCSPAASSVVAVTVFDLTGTPTDVTASMMPSGSATINGAVITLPLLQNLLDGRLYQVAVRYSSDGVNVVEPYFRVLCR